MKRFLTLFMLFIAISSFGFTAPAMPNQASVEFKFTLKTGDLTKTLVGFYPSAVGTYENLITEPAQATSLIYGTDFGGTTGKALYATVGTNWAKAKAASVNEADPSINVTLTMNPFKQDNAENWLGYTVEYRQATRSGSTKGTASAITFNPSGSSASNTTPGVDGNVITVGKTTGTTAGDTVTITSGVGAFVPTDAGVAQQGFLEIEFTNMKILGQATPDYKPTIEATPTEENYTATWTFLVKAE